MKRIGLIVLTAIFFLIVNTNYFWVGKLGFWTIPAFVVLFVVYLILAIGLLIQFSLAVKEKLADRQRLYVIEFLSLVLVLTFFFPEGLIDFNTFDRKDLFIAQSEGAANCMKTFKIKEANKFTERSVCFGVTETKGNYKLKGDTILFTNISLGKGDKNYYEFAVIKKSEYQNEKILGELVKYKNIDDTVGYKLWIFKNDLTK